MTCVLWPCRNSVLCFTHCNIHRTWAERAYKAKCEHVPKHEHEHPTQIGPCLRGQHFATPNPYNSHQSKHKRYGTSMDGNIFTRAGGVDARHSCGFVHAVATRCQRQSGSPSTHTARELTSRHPQTARLPHRPRAQPPSHCPSWPAPRLPQLHPLPKPACDAPRSARSFRPCAQQRTRRDRPE